MNYNFYLPKIETRTKDSAGKPTYIVRGYATTPNHTYTYKTYENKAFREFFTERALESMKNQAKTKKVFVDAEHFTGTKHSVPIILDGIKQRTQGKFDSELDYVKSRVDYSDIPMFKVEDITVDDNGLFVDIRGNPFYREYDEEHKKYFDSVWGSLETGFINGMSLNFKPTSIIPINDGLTKIDDVEIYGISLTGSPSNDMATITEVAMRSIENVRGELKCQKKITTSLLI